VFTVSLSARAEDRAALIDGATPPPAVSGMASSAATRRIVSKRGRWSRDAAMSRTTVRQRLRLYRAASAADLGIAQIDELHALTTRFRQCPGKE